MEIAKEDIDQVVLHFYEQVNQDPLLSPVFNEVAGVDWESHIPRLCRFWHTVLCRAGTYNGNPYQVHMDLAEKTRLESRHFTRWLELFTRQANRFLNPEQAQQMVARAEKIARALQKGLHIHPADAS